MIEEIGGVAIRLAVTPDKTYAIAKKIRDASTKADLILTIGGSSIGKYDVVEKAINSMGSPGILVHGIKLDRGRVTGLGVVSGKPIIVLPGPIQGAINSFVIFAYPLIRSLSNRSGKMPILSATLSHKWEARKNFGSFTKVIYVALSNSLNGFKATPVTGQTESIRLLTKAHGYIIVPERITSMNAGRTVQVHLLPGFSYINDQFVD
jgi:molybdopterin biosynthesis enzyme